MKLDFLNSMESELLERLIQNKVDFAVVGSHAVLCYSPATRPDGTDRTLSDLDILVSTSDVNLSSLSDALTSLRISLTAEQLASIFGARKIPNLTGGYRAQLFPAILGVETDSVLRNAERARSAIGAVPVIAKNALIEAKKAAGRPKDIEDVRALEATVKCSRAV